MNDLAKKYQTEMKPKLQKELGVANVMAIPKLVKIVISCGLGEALADKKVIEKMSEQLGVITGQKPVVRRAKKAISTFKLREGDPIGLKVTLRGPRMWDFLRKFVGIVLPRVRDFHGIPLTGFDGHGNYNLGVSDQTIFSELEYSQIDKVRGMAVTFVTTSDTDEMAKALLVHLGFPFVKN